MSQKPVSTGERVHQLLLTVVDVTWSLFHCCLLQWRSEAKVPPGADHKSAALSTPQTCLQKFQMKVHVSRLFKDIRINKAPSKSQSNTHKLKCVFFLIVDYDSCFFCLSPLFSSIIFLFFAFSA